MSQIARFLIIFASNISALPANIENLIVPPDADMFRSDAGVPFKPKKFVVESASPRLERERVEHVDIEETTTFNVAIICLVTLASVFLILLIILSIILFKDKISTLLKRTNRFKKLSKSSNRYSFGNLKAQNEFDFQKKMNMSRCEGVISISSLFSDLTNVSKMLSIQKNKGESVTPESLRLPESPCHQPSQQTLVSDPKTPILPVDCFGFDFPSSNSNSNGQNSQKTRDHGLKNSRQDLEYITKSDLLEILKEELVKTRQEAMQELEARIDFCNKSIVQKIEKEIDERMEGRELPEIEQDTTESDIFADYKEFSLS